MRLWSIVLGAALALASPAQAQTQAATPGVVRGAQPAPRAEAVRAVVASFPGFSGVVLVARGGLPVFEEAFGEANRELGVRTRIDTRFRIGSMTKAFTAAAIMQLHDAGRLNIGDPVSKYLPDAPEAWRPITLRHLLTHTSGLVRGLPRQTEIMRADITPDQMIALVRDLPLQFQPGARRGYSNVGYVVLGKIIETVSGESYADYVRGHILQPLGMAASGYDVTAEILPGRAAGYSVRGGELINSRYIAMTLPYAAGSLYSTAGDLLKWDQALYGDRLVSAASRAEMFADHGIDYGFGWEVRTKFGRQNISHGGAIPGFSTQIDRYPQDGLTVIVLSNTEGERADAMADDLAALYLGEPPRAPFPGAEAAIRGLIAMIRTGEIDADALTPFVAEDIRAQLAYYQPIYVQLGELRSARLIGVDAPEGERWLLTFENGVVDFRVRFDPAGRIAGVLRREMPR